jgi:hypothetical protein
METAKIGKRAADWLLAIVLLAGFALTSSVLTPRPATHARPAAVATASR